MDIYLLSMVFRAPGPVQWGILWRAVAFLAALTLPFLLGALWATLRVLRRARLIRRIELSPDGLIYIKGGIWRERRRQWTAPHLLPWRIDRGAEKPGRGYLFGLRFGNVTEYFYDRRPNFGDEIAAAFQQVLQSRAAEHHPNA